MQNYDLGPLTNAPALAHYISEAYFDEGKEDRLTVERVQRSSAAAAGLFRWSGQTTARVVAALELQAVEAEIAQISSQVARRRLPHPSILWEPALSHPELVVSADGRAISSGANVEMKAGFGDTVLQDAAFHIPITYDHGTRVFLVVGLCEVGVMSAWDEQGRFRNDWDNGRHAGCWLYSFFYNSLSADGSDWFEKPADIDCTFQPGDELVLELHADPGTLTFLYKSHGSDDLVRLGSFRGLMATYRVIALLGSSNQSVSFA